MVRTDTKRLAYLDGLRGICAMLVVLEHASESWMLHPDLSKEVAAAVGLFNGQLLGLGRIGVAAFFLISGFVIPFSFRSPHALKNFVVARVFRLYPAYWVSIGLALLVFATVDGPRFDGMTVLANLSMLQSALRMPDILGVYWTLFVELLFYGICFVAFFCGVMASKRYLLTMVVTLLTGSALLVSAMGDNGALRALSGHMMFLAMMHMAALAKTAWHDRQADVVRYFFTALGAIVIGIPAISISASRHGGAPWFVEVLSYAVAIGLFLLVVRRELLDHDWLIFLGRISYSLYLFHGIFLLLAIKWSAGRGIGVVTLAMIMAIAAAIGFCALIFRWVERPAIALGKRIAHRFKRDDALEMV